MAFALRYCAYAKAQHSIAQAYEESATEVRYRYLLAECIHFSYHKLLVMQWQRPMLAVTLQKHNTATHRLTRCYSKFFNCTASTSLITATPQHNCAFTGRVHLQLTNSNTRSVQTPVSTVSVICSDALGTVCDATAASYCSTKVRVLAVSGNITNSSYIHVHHN
jgi:hypothetical protein